MKKRLKTNPNGLKPATSGFTLIELLAVIVILAIIALIAVPIIINIIGDSKDKTVNININNYVRALETSIMNKNLEENFDPTSCIIENSIVTCYNENINLGTVDIAADGNKLISGIIFVDDLKPSKIIAGTIEGLDYGEYLYYDNGKIEIKIPKGSSLLNGKSFNLNLKKFITSEALYNSSDTIITSIEFYPLGMLPNGYTKDLLSSLPNVSVSDDGKIIAYYDQNKTSVYIISDNIIYMNSNSSSLFQEFEALNNISNLKYLDTSNVTKMNSMFASCTSLEQLDLSGFDTSKVSDMNNMFFGCTSLKQLDLSGFDTSKVNDMSSMFYAYGTDRFLSYLKFNKATFKNVKRYSNMLTLLTNNATIEVYDNDAKSFIEERLADVKKTGCTIICQKCN